MRLPRWPLLAGPLIAVLAMGGLRWSAATVEARLASAADLVVARQAAAYLAAVGSPGVSGAYDVPRLISAAHLLAGSPSWTGGLQVSLGDVPLLPDSTGLTPLPGAALAALSLGTGAATVRHASGSATVVPFLDRDRWDVVGWVATWDSFERRPPAADSWVLMAVAASAVILSGLAAAERVPARWCRPTVLLAVGALLALALDLGWGLRDTARRATETQLRTARQLVEVAATARGVRPADLPAMGGGIAAIPYQPVSVPGGAIVRGEVDGVRVASIRAQTSRHGGGIEFTIPTLEDRLVTADFILAAWVGLAALALLFSAWASGARRNLVRFHHLLAAWGFLAPALAHLALFSFFPALFTFYLSFHRWDLLAPGHQFVGLTNFGAAFADARFLHSLGISALYALHVPLTAALALGAAVLLDRAGIVVRVLRTILFVPFISSVVAVALVWQWIYQPEAGLLNTVLGWAGIGSRDWLGDPRTALLGIMAMSVWVQIGYQMVVFLGGLQSIPSTYHDSARVDGAGPWKRFWWITLPLLRPTVLFVLVTGVIGSFQVFTYVAVMTEGGPLNSTDVVVYRIYQEAWEFLRFGTASAMSVTLLVVLLALTWAQFRWLGRRVEMV